ncbi:MAG: hypothetical protein ABSG96_07540 [Terracidiphilus sp.]|jgi:hypothetical protein
MQNKHFKVAICATTLLFSLSAFGFQAQIGVDESNLSAKPEAVRAQVLAGVKQLGATWFRDAFTSKAKGGVADWVDEVRLAKQQNLKFLETINPVSSDFDATTPAENAGPDFSKRCGWSSGSRKLSAINLTKFTTRLRTEFDALKAAGISIDAFEIGNELDWICFNGDVPDGHTPAQAEFMTAVRAYAQYLKAAATLIHSPQYFPNAKIITFGMAHGSDQWDRPAHHFNNPASMIAQLRNLDGFNYLSNSSYKVDGYGVHLYPSAESVGNATETLLRQDISVLGKTLPLWITEWGLDVRRFPNKSGQSRAQAIAEFYSSLNGSGAIIGPVFFYSYDGPAGGSILASASGEPLADASAVMRGGLGSSAKRPQ